MPVRVSVVIPARNEASIIGRAVRAVLTQGLPPGDLEVIVVDDGSTDATSALATASGARVVATGRRERGSPGVARNVGAAAAAGEILIFLDADCVPEAGWLAALLAAHERGESIVGGSLSMPAGLGASARCDYYNSCYHMHPGRPAGIVPHHSPANLSVRRDLFRRTSGFSAAQPVADGHEELGWQATTQRMGHRIYFEPRAAAAHHNDPGLGRSLRRSYRWGYSALQSKAETGVARLRWLYRVPALGLAAAAPAALGQVCYITGCWLVAGKLEPLLLLPGTALAQLAYAAGVVVGGARWLRSRNAAAAEHWPRWR